MTCKRCKTADLDARCAFDTRGVFQPDNMDCGTMLALMNLAEDKHRYTSRIWDNDQNFAQFTFNEGCGVLTLTWYKSRGRFDGAICLIENEDVETADTETEGSTWKVRPLTIDIAEAILCPSGSSYR